MLHSLDRTQLIYTCILLSFSLSLIIHDSRAEVQRFMIPKFLKQRFKILTYFVSMIHDSASTPKLRWLPRVFTNNPSYQAYVTEGNLVTLSLRYCSRDSPLRLPI